MLRNLYQLNATGDKSPTGLSAEHPCYEAANTLLTVAYHLGARGQVELCIWPTALRGALATRRAKAAGHPQVNDGGIFAGPGDDGDDNLVQLHLRGERLPEGFIAGRAHRQTALTGTCRYVEQHSWPVAGGTLIETVQTYAERITLRHRLYLPTDGPGCFVQVQVQNTAACAEVIEHISSFVISKISPFAEDDMCGRMRLHRVRSNWSAEGKWEAVTPEAMNLERSWGAYSHLSERYGQAGSLPVRGYFPFIGIEDSEAAVHWGAQLYWHGSWNMEYWRRKDPYSLSGGLGDFDSAQWHKQLQAGESFEAPMAWLCSVRGGVEDLCEALKWQYRYTSHVEPEREQRMPVIFNEWCASWGHPTHADTLRKAQVLKAIGIEQYVIDDGWAAKPKGCFQYNGDWQLDTAAFPQGMAATVEALAAEGLQTGIWYEAEVCTDGTQAYQEDGLHLTRNGHAIRVGNRKFLDFRKRQVRARMDTLLGDFLAANGLKYLKIDYNDSIGIGVDPENSADGLGEGLRAHLDAVYEYYLALRRRLPELVFENCASGGHRIEPSMVALSSMSSFSDAHETVEIPLIAANIQRLIPARKNQVWAVMRAADTQQRLEYSLAATFLGRMCLSGDVEQLSEAALATVSAYIKMYQQVRPMLVSEQSRTERCIGDSYRYPKGWQIVLREGTLAAKRHCLVVMHCFETAAQTSVEVALPTGDWKLKQVRFAGQVDCEAQRLRVTYPAAFSGGVALLEAAP